MADTNHVNEGDMDEPGNTSEYIEHAKRYTDFLGNYRDYTKRSNEIKNKYKRIFFWIIVVILGTLIGLFVYSVCHAFRVIEMSSEVADISVKNVTGAAITSDKAANFSMESMAAVITAVISSFSAVLTALLQLPKIVAKYLFNKEEDIGMAKIIGQIQQNDRDMYSIEKGVEKKMMANGVSDMDMSVVDASEECPDNPGASENSESTSDINQDIG